MSLDKLYPYIRAYGEAILLNERQIVKQQQIAYQENAPHRAAYYSANKNKWIILDGIGDKHKRQEITKRGKEIFDGQ